MIVLDTNVISELMRAKPETRVLAWLDHQPAPSIWTSAVSIYELRSGMLSMPAGRKSAALTAFFEEWFEAVLDGRVLAFDLSAAERAAELEAASLKSGRSRDRRDTMIAGIVLASHATLATRNVKHFEDIAKSVVNPWA